MLEISTNSSLQHEGIRSPITEVALVFSRNSDEGFLHGCDCCDVTIDLLQPDWFANNSGDKTMNSLRRLPTAELIRRAWLEICAIPNSWFDSLFSDLFSFYEYPHKEQTKDRVD